MTNKLIGGLVAIVIGLALLPVVADFVDDLTGSGGTFEDCNIGTMIDLIPVLYVIIIVAGVAAYVVTSRKG
jgi:triacylglycerol esterase/lipase EstA (alpha/beta hydrolase family)